MKQGLMHARITCPGIIFTVLLGLCLISCDRTGPEHPNVVVILTDDQGWGDLSMNGNLSLSTPNIDGLAGKGVVFDRFYVCPVCSPTRAEFLTGRYHVRGGVYSTSTGGERLDLDETTVAEVFREAGYATAAYGKWHNGMQAPYHPNSRGFDDYYGFCSGHWGNYFSPMLEHNGELVRGEGYIIDDLTDHGLDFIENNSDRPFFLYLPYNTPHSPMQVPDRWWEKYEDMDIQQGGTLAGREDPQHTKAALAMCENIDWNVGRILSKLDELDLAENTIVIYFSDNGPNGHRWNGGMKGTKGSTDEGGVRSPMIMAWEGKIKTGRTIGEIASAIDLLPTLADLAGVQYEPEKPLDGISLKPLLLEEDPDWQDRLIFSFWRDRLSVRSQDYRLDHEGQLYNMIEDPGQKMDIAEDEPEILQWLSGSRDRWLQEIAVELPDEDKRPITIGHPGLAYTQLPARDAKSHGNLLRSSRHPNNSFFTNWKDPEDMITWDAEVLADGRFEVVVYYTCPEGDIGSLIELEFNGASLNAKIETAHDPPATGMENDRSPRTESYVKDFIPLHMGSIDLEKGRGTLTLKALDKPGSQVMDFRLLMLKRI